MATITRVSRKEGYAYLARIDLKGITPFSTTFKLRKHAKAWAERTERNIDEARAYGNSAARTMTLGKFDRGTYRGPSGGSRTVQAKPYQKVMK